MLSWLPTSLIHVLSNFAFYRNAEKMRIEPILVALGFRHVNEVDWSSSGGLDDFLSYRFVTGTVQGNAAEKTAPMKRLKVDDGSEVPEFIPAVDVDWLSSVACKTISKVEHDYRWYRCVSDGDEGPPADVPAIAPDVVDDIFVQELLWEGDCGALFTASDRSVIAIALSRLSKTVLTCYSKSADLIGLLVNEAEAFRVDTANTVKKVKRRKKLVFIAGKSTNITLNDVTSFCNRVAVASTHESE